MKGAGGAIKVKLEVSCERIAIYITLAPPWLPAALSPPSDIPGSTSPAWGKGRGVLSLVAIAIRISILIMVPSIHY